MGFIKIRCSIWWTKCLYLFKTSVHESSGDKKYPSIYTFWLAYRAYSFQSPTCTKANRPYILSPYNQDGDRTAAIVEP